MLCVTVPVFRPNCHWTCVLNETRLFVRRLFFPSVSLAPSLEATGFCKQPSPTDICLRLLLEITAWQADGRSQCGAEASRGRPLPAICQADQCAGRDNADQEAGKTGAHDWRRRRTRNMAGSICKHSQKTGTWLKYSTTNMPEQTKT